MVVAGLSSLVSGLWSQSTRAEQSKYTVTSSHADVVAFLDSLHAEAPDRVWIGSIGKTIQGRELVYAIASRPLVKTPAEAKRLRRPIVYIEGNIHSGEVEGKEALQALLRDLVLDPKKNVLDSIVLIAVPDYNADGNDNQAPQARNRGAQNGPEMVGTRPNAMGLNLNRDYVKAETPETRASLAMFNAWDPDVFVDLHTTDGSYHGYALTYAPSLHPAAELAATTFGGAFARDSMLPVIRQRMQTRHNFAVFDYGDFMADAPRRGGGGGGGGGRGRGGDTTGGRGAARGAARGAGDTTGGRGARGGARGGAGFGGGGGGGILDTMPQAWKTYEHTPRYGTNYYALRGRISILSEAYSHDPFERRVKSTYAFVQEILAITAEKASSIFAIEQRSDRNLAAGKLADVPIRAQMTTHPVRLPIALEVMLRNPDTVQTEPGVNRLYKRSGRIKLVEMNSYTTFEATKTIKAPNAYLIPANEDSIVAMLRLHGITVEKLRAAWSGPGETFAIDSIVKLNPFEGHAEDRLEGRWTAGTVKVPAGSYVVRTTQPLGVLAVILLEPECDDGLATWNFFDPRIAVGQSFPVLRARAAVPAQ